MYIIGIINSPKSGSIKKRTSELYNLIKNQTYIQPGEGRTLLFFEMGTIHFLNSDEVIYNQFGQDLEKFYSENERILLRGYCRTLPFDILFKCIDCSDKEEWLKLILNGEKVTSERLYMNLIRVAKRF